MSLYTTAVHRRRPRPACVTVQAHGSACSLWHGHNRFAACVIRERPSFEGRPPEQYGPRASLWDNSSRQRSLGCENRQPLSYDVLSVDCVVFPPEVLQCTYRTSYSVLRRIPYNMSIYMWSITNTDSSAGDSEIVPTISASDRDPFASNHGPTTCFSSALSTRVQSPGLLRAYPVPPSLGVARRRGGKRPWTALFYAAS